jgi:integrase
MPAKYLASWASVSIPNVITHQDGRCKVYLFTPPYRFHYGREIPGPGGQSGSPPPRSPFGYSGPRRAAAGFQVKRPRRLFVPLTAEQVAQFWRSFRTFRDLSLIALMLLDGLRSHEVLHLELEDLRLAQAQLWVHGKGHKDRLLPLPADTIQVLENYLHLERPLTNSPYLFVSLKGRQRGQPMTPAGLRSLFRHHRCQSQVPQANPHRLRHYAEFRTMPSKLSAPLPFRLFPKTRLGIVCAGSSHRCWSNGNSIRLLL